MKYRIEYESDLFNVSNIDARKSLKYVFDAVSDESAMVEMEKFKTKLKEMSYDPYGTTYKITDFFRIDQEEKTTKLAVFNSLGEFCFC